MKKSFSDRIIEEFNDFSKIPLIDIGITVELIDNNDPTKWKVTIFNYNYIIRVYFCLRKNK